MAPLARDLTKRIGGGLLARGGGAKFDYANAIFILAHMRCGSTALSNIICSRPDVSGYGEAHVRYDGRGALGQLALNQMRRKGWNGKASHLFDKILHSRHDRGAPDAFFTARAIFVIREPEPAIRSIRKLFVGLGRDEYTTHETAALYYTERLGALASLWDRFPAHRRIGVTHSGLLQHPDTALATISRHLAFDPPLHNSYRSLAASRQGGGGDPTQSGRYSRIEPALLLPAGPLAALGLPAPLASSCEDAFQAMKSRLAADFPALAGEA